MTAYSTSRIMVVEDDPQGITLLSMVLEDMGVEDIVTAEDGDQAWRTFNDHAGIFDVVISDWNMAGMSGLELLEKIRDTNDNMPFIMITGRGTMDSVVQAKERDVTSFLPKPFTPKQLQNKVKSVLAGRV